MSGVKELYLLSKELYDHLLVPFPIDDAARDEYVDKITAVLDKRENVLTKLGTGAEFSEVEKKLGQEIVKLNNEINPKLEKLKSDIRGNIAELKAKRENGQKYENPYDGPTIDGVFFDKRGV